jgi:sugar/nucleoside kinase (ribokinase family)
VDRAGIRVSALPTPRATQFLEADGSRTHVWHVPQDIVGAQLSRALEYVPASYRRARGFHFGTHPESPDLSFAADLRALGGVVSLEMFKVADRPLRPESLRALVSAPHIFSPDWTAARSLVGVGQPVDVARRLIEVGVGMLTLRMGARGSLVVNAEARQAVRIPATPVNVVEETGAGNAYCGGFLVGWVETRDLVEAGLRGAVSASFLLERVGVPVVNDKTRWEAHRRLEALRARIEAVTV